MNSGPEQTLLLEMARDAGSLLLQFFRQPIRIEAKGPQDIVTEADFAAEELIRSGIRASFPSDSITAEEGGTEGAALRRWYVDPLDGTVNFSLGIAVFAVCIAFYDEQGASCSVVYNPAAGECFTAVRGGGAFLNGLPIRCGKTTDLAAAHIWINPHGLRYPDRAERLLDVYRRLGRTVTGILNPGSMSQALCAVAACRLDAAVALDVDAFSTPASALIMSEAGVRVTDFGSVAYTPGSSTLLAANEPLHSALTRNLSSMDEQ